MAIHIQGAKNIKEKLRNESKIQRMPFTIYADCDAPVSKYFDVYVKPTEDQKMLTASFRGYPLKGSKVDLPEGYTGLVFHESIRPSTEKEERTFYIVDRFSSFINWNWDKAPSQNDTVLQALEWVDIAEALHSPIMEE